MAKQKKEVQDKVSDAEKDAFLGIGKFIVTTVASLVADAPKLAAMPEIEIAKKGV